MSVVTAWLPDRARVTARVLRPAPAGVYGTERTGDLPEATMRLSLPITRSTSRVRGGDYIEIGATRWEPPRKLQVYQVETRDGRVVVSLTGRR